MSAVTSSRLAMCALLAVVSVFSTGCQNHHAEDEAPATGAYLKSSDEVPLGGIPYAVYRPTEANPWYLGVTKDDGFYGFDEGDVVIFYLAGHEQIVLALIEGPLADETTLLFDHLADSTELFREKLVRVLGSLDGDAAADGVQVPAAAGAFLLAHAGAAENLLDAGTSLEDFVKSGILNNFLKASGKADPGLLSYQDASEVLGLPFESYPIELYPYETVYGEICHNSEPTPGCTFFRTTDDRITVAEDPDYDQYGFGSDDLWFVRFDGSGNADVYNDLGVYQYTARVNDFAGYIGGTTIGVGTSGYYWENVSNQTYWFGDNGVLYSAMALNPNYQKAIN